MYEKILVPLDGSELAEVALPYAEELSGRFGSSITLINVREPIYRWADHMYFIYMGQMTRIIKQLTERYVERPKKSKAIKVEAKFLVGDPAEEIIKYAEKVNNSLIVMATHGQSGLKRWSTGNVADKVIRTSKQPVWLIRAKGACPDVCEINMLDRTLVPLDGSKESEAVIPYIEGFASGLKAEVTLLQVVPLGYYGVNTGQEGYEYVFQENQMASDRRFAEAYLDKVEAQLKRKGVKAKSEVRFGNVAEEIIQLAVDIHADVVAMSTHGRSGVGRWILGSVAENVLREGNTPLLLVRSSGASMEYSNQHQEISKKYPVTSRS